MKAYGIKKSDMSQLMVTIVSFSVFPALAYDMITLLMSIVSFSVFPALAYDMITLLMPELKERKRFNEYMRERKDFASELLFTALKNRKK
jgi:hypothetical protein